MKTILISGDFGSYKLGPVNRRLAAKLKAATGSDTVLFQSDWDRPALARNLGWSGKIGRERCDHRGTDGTVTCPDCQRDAGDFIAAATDWLDAHDGCIFVGKGEEYFNM